MQIGNGYKEKVVLFKAGQPANNLYKIDKGNVLCLKYLNGRLIPIYLAGPGDSIGDETIIAGSNYSYHAVTFTHVEVQIYSSSAFAPDLNRSVSWLKDLLNTMLERFDHTSNLIAENRLESSYILEPYTSSMEIELKKLLGLK